MRYIERHRGWRHIRQLRAIAPLVNGSAESPPESWVRLLMIRGDLPSPDVQIQVQDESGQIIARIDLGYRAVKIGIEYDGEEFHSGRMQRERDARRDERLESLGWKMIRIDAERMREEPWLILAEIETALRARGYY
ncbi:DUF559 domain-containing protein [Gordonia crocea]|nr:DUF559 domain-containing protein [Gordonia crocea]